MVATTETGPFYNQVNSDPQPVRAFTSTQHNDDCTQTNTFHLSQTVTHTNSYTASLTSTVGMENSLEVKVGIPLVAEVTVSGGWGRSWRPRPQHDCALVGQLGAQATCVPAVPW